MCQALAILSMSQVNYILDEIVMAGMVLETNADLIQEAIKDNCNGTFFRKII